MHEVCRKIEGATFAQRLQPGVFWLKYMQVSQVSISNWERGVKEPSYQALIDLSNLFGKTTDYMLGLKDND